MYITFNDQLQEITAGSPLQFVINQLIGEKQTGIAVAINNTVVPRAQWAERILQNNDYLLVIKAAQGG